MQIKVLTKVWERVDCKTVRIFGYSSTHEQSNKRSGTRLKTESETGERRFFLSRLTRPTGGWSSRAFARIRLLRQALPISLLILRKDRLFCSLVKGVPFSWKIAYKRVRVWTSGRSPLYKHWQNYFVLNCTGNFISCNFIRSNSKKGLGHMTSLLSKMA